MQSSTVLLYQEDPGICQVTRDIALGSNWFVYICETICEMKYSLSNKSIQALIIEMDDTEMELQLLKEIQRDYQDIYIILVTRKASVEVGVATMKLGALDYLTFDSLASNLPRIFQDIQNRINARNQFNKSSLSIFQESVSMIGISPAFQQVLRKSTRAACEEETILISGETGTGKGLLAKGIHTQSPRSGSSFIKVNCGAIPETLLESELFGHEKGAYTGATSTQDGFFQAAHGGTLFLDEIDNTSFAVQAKLLQAIEEREVWKVGARRPDQVDVRIFSASNTSLERQVEEGKFREDLYYRLDVLSLHIPPLRERHEDILPLCYYFAQRWALAHNKTVPIFSDRVLAYLQSYTWPGNVRELEHLVAQLLTYAPKNEITLEMLPGRIRNPIHNQKTKPFSLEAIIKDHIHSICTSTNWNITQAASLLGLTRQGLYRKLHQFNLGEY